MGISSVTKGAVSFTKSLWNDPYRWSLVKSISVFAVAICFARAIEAHEAEEIAETAAKLSAS